MTWDLFNPPPPPPRSRGGRQTGRIANEELARRIAAREADRAVASRRGSAEEWTVSAVNAAMREVVEAAFPPLWVVGEITGFTRARSGHCYFTLRDASSQLKCVMWRDEARRLPTAPEEGMEVRVLGRLTLYESKGEYQLSVVELEARGEGLWKLAMDRLRVKLDGEGLTAPGRKRALPRYPAAIGVVTSPSGAVLQDIVTVVRRRAPWTRVVLCGCRVQGEGAGDEVAAAIRLLSRAACVDVIIVARGGGSVEDLWAFNEEVVARAIADSPVPTISAVGHETDVTIADLVADLRAPTPSAAAEAAVPDVAVVARDLSRLSNRLAGAAAARVARAGETVRSLGREISDGMDAYLLDARAQVARSARHLDALSPLAAFGRGFAIPLAADGRVLRRAADLAGEKRFDLRMSDGVVPCRVDERQPFGPGGEA